MAQANGEPDTAEEWYAAAKRAASSAHGLRTGPRMLQTPDYDALALYYRILALHFFARALIEGNHPERLRPLRSL